jgi:hypothetical protein
MGQTVLNIHNFEDVLYPAHSFYSEFKNDDKSDLQVPITCKEDLQGFHENFAIERHGREGLSVVIPFPIDDLQPEAMIITGINNYFYPIIMDQLVLNIGGTIITSENIRKLASEHITDNEDIDETFDFIFAMKSANEHKLPELHENWSDDRKLNEDDVDEDLLEEMRIKFANGELVGVKLPLTITKIDGEKIPTGFSVFVKRPENLSKGKDLYLRGGLTLPEEKKFGERKALGALIATEENIAGFLGDAENAAHTKWNENAEKLNNNYYKPSISLRLIRHSVVNFYDMLAQAVEEEDETALIDFFWKNLPGQQDKPKKAGGTPPDIKELPKPKPKLCNLNRIEGGFSIRPGNDIRNSLLPFKVRIRVCYDTGSGDPFRKFSPLDFDLRKNDSLPIKATVKSLKVIERGANLIEMEVTDPDFKFSITGFDPNRDLLLKLNTMEG